jgi:hypothetical protein
MTSRDPNHDRLSHDNEKFQRILTADTPSDWIALMAIAVRRKSVRSKAEIQETTSDYGREAPMPAMPPGGGRDY